MEKNLHHAPIVSSRLADIVILGCGYTGRRVAGLLSGHRIIATSRDPASLAGLPVDARGLDALRPETVGALAGELRRGFVALHSVPVLRTAESGSARPTPLLRSILERARRVVYLSTTGVYGETPFIDESTRPAPRTPREVLRFEEETDVAAIAPQSLILRPAAIYGPGRGVHVSMMQGRHRYWGDGSNYISRVHADDLAAIAAKALLSDLTGAYPVADDEPATALEITRFCAEMLRIPVPGPTEGARGEDTRGSNRRVDGRRIRELLGVELRYPSYRVGIRNGCAL